MKYHLLMVLAIALVVVRANENSDGSKVKIIDNSRVLTADEVANLPDKDKIPVVVPLLKNPSAPVIMPKIGVVVKSDEPSSAKSAIDQKAADVINNNNNNDAKLQPIPLIMPSFLNNVFDQPIMDDSLGGESGPVASSGDDKPSGILNVLVLRSHRVEDPSNPDSGVKSSFVIMRFLPKSIGNWFGLDSSDAEQQKLLGGGDDDVDKKRIHLFGGDDDIDHKRMHLLGGGDDDVDKKRMMHGMMGGEGDPDHMRIDRIGLDENSKGVFTGGSEDVFSNTAEQQHKIFVFSMFDRLRSMFDNMRQTFEQQVPSFSVDSSESDPSKMESVVPFISIRTDDGQSALIPNDIGYAEKQQHEQSLNKCMMLQFMRLKASMYYRTILHLLFFTGVLLFIFSLFMLMVRACRRRQLARRHHHHHHHHHRNMSIASIEAGKSKLAAYKAWQGMDQSSLIDSDKVVLIQAPPAYDQVFIHDKNSTLTSSAAHPSFSTEKSSDECETKSLPPDYEENKAAEK